MTVETYDAVRVYNQKRLLVEINTWVKYKLKKNFPNYKRLNTVLILESNL